MRNLDQRAAEIAQEIVKDAAPKEQTRDVETTSHEGAQKIVKDTALKELDNLATKTLGVLQENGPYACVLFLRSRSIKEQKLATHIVSHLQEALSEVDNASSSADADLSARIVEIAGNLDTLLLVKQLWEQILIYVRYGAKAAQEK